MVFHADLPSRVSTSSKVVCIMLVLTSCVTSTTLGYDGSMMNALNILPSYTDYFSLDTTTLALNTASVWIGNAVAGLTFGKVPDIIGRKWGLLYGATFTLIGVILQAAAQNVAMFVVARIIIGFGTGASSIVGPVFLAETLPVKYRAWGLGIFYDFWYVGGLTSAGVTYGTAKMSSTWAWRLPSALQGLFSIMCIVLIWFVPESPRWLESQGRPDAALNALAQTYSNGEVDDAVVMVQYRVIADTLSYERAHRGQDSLEQIVRNPSSRKRMLLVISVAVFCMLSGNNIVSYYLGTILTQAGVTNTTTQLEINIILNAFCLIVSVVGTACADPLGRKPLAIISTGGLTVCLFLVGILTKIYGNSTNQSGIYGTVAAIFLFQGAYSFGWTPLTVMYPPEVLNYSIRSVGMAIYTFVVNGVGLMVTFAFPFALAKIGWKTYMINGAWDVFELVVVIVYWVETKGRTLEEIDENLDGEVHSDMPKLREVLGIELEKRQVAVAFTKDEEAGQTVVDVKALQ